MEGSLTRKRRVTREFTLGALVAAYIVFLALTTGFGSTSGLFSMMLDVSPTIVGAIAMSLIIFTGNIDISAGTILGFVGFVAAILAKAGLPIVVWLPAGLLTGMFLAGLNGWLSVTFKVPTIVVTLAMNMVHIGFYVTFLPNAGWVLNLSDTFTALGQGQILRSGPLHLRDRRGRCGPASSGSSSTRGSARPSTRWAATGRPPSTRESIPTGRSLWPSWWRGCSWALPGILKATTANRLMPSVFQGREMIFIAAAVVGGVNIMGGSGKLLGAVFGALLVYLLSITMIYLGFQDYFQFALQGIIILIAVFITVTDFGPARKLLRKAFRRG